MRDRIPNWVVTCWFVLLPSLILIALAAVYINGGRPGSPGGGLGESSTASGRA